MEDEDLSQLLKERTHDLEVYEQKLNSGMYILRQMVTHSLIQLGRYSQ